MVFWGTKYAKISKFLSALFFKQWVRELKFFFVVSIKYLIFEI